VVRTWVARLSTGSGQPAAHLKELQQGRPVREMVLLVAGERSSNWQRWYDAAIPLAEARYAELCESRS